MEEIRMTPDASVSQSKEKRLSELSRFSDDLEGRSAEDILEWAASHFGKGLTFATGFGAEGCVLIDLIGKHNIPIDIFTLDTGLLFQETYDLWHRLESQCNIKIRGIKPELDVDQQAAMHGDRLWERAPDTCCNIRKVVPLKATLANVDAWVTAIRRDQTAERAKAQIVEWDHKFNIAKINPLVAWTKNDVWQHILTNKVPYNPLHDNGYPSIGCWPCTSQVKPGEDDRAGRWRGNSKNECGLHSPEITNQQE